jgi:hypothetical protein
VLVHLVTAFEDQLELIHAERQRDRQPDRRPHRIAPTDPIPHREAVLRRDQERVHCLGVGRDCGEVPRRCALAQAVDDPMTRELRVGERLQRREGLRAHDEQRARGIGLLEHVAELHAVDVRHAVQAQVAVAKLCECLGRHHDAEVRAADADVHDIRERLAGRAVNAPALHAFDEVAHFGEARAHFGHHVLTLDEDRAVRAVAQGDVQDGTILGGVDLLAGEHRRDPLVEAARLRELDQQAQRLRIEELAGEIEQQVQFGARELLETLRIGREQIAQMPLPHLCGMRRQCLPLRKGHAQPAL